MDIVASTENGNIIDVEMERSLKNASPLRARFHASILDSSLSYVNEKWEKLPEIYIIFICEKDVLETNRLKNHIQRYGEDGEAFEDKVHIIYMNATKEGETPLGKLMHDLRCENHEDMYDEVLKERVRYFKQKEGGYIEIIVDHESRIFQLNKKRQSLYPIYELNELLRNEIIKKYKNHMPSYEQLYQNQILHQQNMTMKNAYDYQEEFKKEIKRQQIEVDELKDIYHMLMEDKQKALKQNQKLMQVGQYHDALIYVDHMDKIASYHDCLLQYIQHKAHDLETTQEIYRRLDILNAILKKNGDSI